MAFLLDGKPLAVDVPFTSGDINYPANWLRLSTAEEKAAIGITEVADAPVYDQRFYNSSGVAKALDGVKTKLKLEEKEIAKRTGDTSYYRGKREATFKGGPYVKVY